MNAVTGAAISAKMKCNAGHEEVWYSSKSVGDGRGSMPYINILLAVHIFMTGLQFDKVKAFFKHCNILFISAPTYYTFMKSRLYPVIWSFWLLHQARNLATIMVIFLAI